MENILQQLVKKAAKPKIIKDSTELRIRMVLTGVTPIMVNPKNDEISPKEMSPEEQAKLKIHQDSKGVHGIPAMMLYRTWVMGGKEVEVKLVGKTRKSLLTSSKGGSKVGSFISFEQNFFPFLNQKEKWVLDSQQFPAENAAGKMTQQIAHRPRWDKWAIEVVAILDVSELSEDDFMTLVARSGKRVGIGSYSPRCGGWFGKYKITQWEHC
ncbi:hypothetical protein A3A38_04100 [Candidatus Kaiserbacteria bacterium RIFCSPLOWO2_01_FULL_53_17]|uniref:Uncharacterized protein n=1 Tax=Candidatus Kaiserbacteria bacterium RIFCSPLOWO2_01_FULL_53_17 TaxID=1798511 RepID=A0A1F6EGW0_9BACT|nr:MAG: hypothetical protein A3A38_04100 [Candidatus Kaiserbacteria bacterium RIFCSPLOWO2_01_FULL_53_17]